MTTAKCPICGKPVEPQFRPFCSPRCADIDLHRWLTGGYSIPGEDEDESEGGPPPEDLDEAF
ncbi:MAG: DNA gyrase inhibitor YacG [Caulobacteraceae bacterium]